MLHWICPDCGNDCSPTVRECPGCANAPVRDVSPSQDAVTEGVLALARSLQPSMDMLLLAPAPQQLLLAAVNGNGHSNGNSSTIAVKEEDVRIPEDDTIDSLVRPLVESAEATPVVEDAVDAASLIEACVAAVAMAVGLAITTAPARVEEVPVIETTQTPPVLEASVEALALAVEEVLAVATTQAPPVVDAVAG